MAGLTIGFVSLDITQIKILIRTGDKKINRLRFLLHHHHLALVSLILVNAIGNEALPVFLSRFLNESGAIVLSTTLVLLIGELIPSAIFSGPKTISIMAFCAPLIYVTIFISFPVAYPLSKILDWLIGGERAQKSYRRSELKEFLRLQLPLDDTNHHPPVNPDFPGSPTVSPLIIHLSWSQRISRWWSSFTNLFTFSSSSSSSSTSNRDVSVIASVSDTTSSAFSFDTTVTHPKRCLFHRLFSQKKSNHSPPSASPSTMYIIPLLQSHNLSRTSVPADDHISISHGPSLSTIPILLVSPESKWVVPSESTINPLLFSQYGTLTPVRIMSPHLPLPPPPPPPLSVTSLPDSSAWNTFTDSSIFESSMDTHTLSASEDNDSDEFRSEFTTDSEIIAGYVRTLPPEHTVLYPSSFQTGRSTATDLVPVSIVNNNDQTVRLSMQSIAESSYEQHSIPCPSSLPEYSNVSLPYNKDIDEESLSQRELGILEGTLDLRVIPISSRMIPLHQTFMLSTDDVLNSRTLNQLIETGHSRIPIYRQNNTNDIKGILLVKLLLKIPWKEVDQVSVDSVPLVRPLILHPRTSMLEALRRFQTGRSHMAMITKYVEPITNRLDPCSNLQSLNPFGRNPNDSFTNTNVGITSIVSSNRGWTASSVIGNPPSASSSSFKTKQKMYSVEGMITLEDCLEQLLRVPIYDETDFITAHSRSIVYKEMKEKHKSNHRQHRNRFSTDRSSIHEKMNLTE